MQAKKSITNDCSTENLSPMSNRAIKRQIVNTLGQNTETVEENKTFNSTETPQKPPYYHEVVSPEWPGIIASLDMLRLEISIKPNIYEELCRRLDLGKFNRKTNTATDIDYVSSNRLAGYRCLWTYNTEKGSASIGLGWNKPTGCVDKSRGFLEFNPNKVGDTWQLEFLFDLLMGYGLHLDVKRLDLAIDYEKPRNMLTLLKDRRKYEFHSDKASTEYLGKKSNIGRVKLYDKHAEMGMSESCLTRLELTVGLNLIEVLALWPKILDSSKVGNLSGKDLAFLAALLDLVTLGQPVEKYLEICKPWTARRFRKLLEPQTLDAPTDLIISVLRQADEWARFGKLVS